MVAFGVALSLWATGVLEFEQSLGGFGEPTVIFIASLVVVSEGLDSMTPEPAVAASRPSYLPPLWGFFATRWLQRNSYL